MNPTRFVSEPPAYDVSIYRYVFWLEGSASLYVFVRTLPEIEMTFLDTETGLLWAVLLPLFARDQISANLSHHLIKDEINDFLDCQLDPEIWREAIYAAFAVVGDYVGTIDNRDDDADSWEPPF